MPYIAMIATGKQQRQYRTCTCTLRCAWTSIK